MLTQNILNAFALVNTNSWQRTLFIITDLQQYKKNLYKNIVAFYPTLFSAAQFQQERLIL